MRYGLSSIFSGIFIIYFPGEGKGRAVKRGRKGMALFPSGFGPYFIRYATSSS